MRTPSRSRRAARALFLVLVVGAFGLTGLLGVGPGRPSDVQGSTCGYDPFGLGAARSFTVLGLDPPSPGGAADFDIGTTATTITGDFGIGPHNTGTLNKGTINGDLYVDPTATTNYANVGGSGFPISGTIVSQSLVAESNAALA